MAHKPLASQLVELSVEQLLSRYPFVDTFFAERGLELLDEPESRLGDVLARMADEREPSWREKTLGELESHVQLMLEFVADDTLSLRELTIVGGNDKHGRPEPVRELVLRAGEVVCLVGPTGCGKSRLLADIEWVAQADTPTARRVLIDGEEPDRKLRFSGAHKLVAQLSQNMSFVMDLSVGEFIALHAESRGAEDPADLIRKIFDEANALAGEPFTLETPVTSLSGGQSRALMIADTAILSSSPVVLIDEIENAGIDRGRALGLLLQQQKVVLMATHDPILALRGDRRVVLRNGAMQRVIEPSEKERQNLAQLESIDARLMALRDRLRAGELLDEI